MRPLIITPTLNQEIAACGGFLATFASGLETNISEVGGEIDVRQQARVMYMNLCDYSDYNGNYVPLKKQVDAIKNMAEISFFTWECVYWGRKNNNFYRLNYEKFERKIKERINFYNPTHIFVQETDDKIMSNISMVNRTTINIVRSFSTPVSMYSYSTDYNAGIFYPFTEYHQEEKLAAYSYTATLSDIFNDTERVRTTDNHRGQLVGHKRAEIFKPINIINKTL